MNTPVTFADLDQMAAEVLPERTVLGVVVAPAGGGGSAGSSSSSAAAAGGGAVDGGGAAALNSCSSTTSFQQQGVLGLLGLGTQQVPVVTTTCAPGAVASY